MKKVLFVVLAAFTMSVAFIGCKDSKKAQQEQAEMDDMDDDDDDDAPAAKTGTVSADNPEQQAVAIMENMVAALKETKVKTAGDLQKFKETMEGFQKQMEELQAMVGEDYESSLPEDVEKALEEKVEKLQTEMMPEITRIMKEAGEAGIDQKDLEGLF